MLFALGKVLELVLGVYGIIMFLHVVFSWVGADSSHQFVKFVNTVTEPLLMRIRKAAPVVWKGFDFSPAIVLVVIYFLLNLIHVTFQ